jgi:hypothetical protein
VFQTREAQAEKWISAILRLEESNGRLKMKRFWVLAFAAFLIWPSLGFGEDEYTSVEGDWWISIKGETKGVAALTFDNLEANEFDVTGFGFAINVGEFFNVLPGQSLQFDSKGNITGTIEIEDTNGVLGTIEIESGKTKKNFTRLDLKGTLTTTQDPMDVVSTKIEGSRLPEDPEVLTGRTPESGKISGGGLSTKKYDVTVQLDEVQGFPQYQLFGTGLVNIDKAPTDVSIDMEARFILDKKGKVFGTFSSQDGLGDGLISKGKLKSKKIGGEPTPKIKLKIEADRTFELNATLTDAVDPIMSVNPRGTVDFGKVKIGDSSSRVFTVTNIGVDTLEGSAKITEKKQAFAVELGSPYTLGPDESAPVTIVFQPNSKGDFEGKVEFSGGGSPTRNLKGKGVD